MSEFPGVWVKVLDFDMIKEVKNQLNSYGKHGNEHNPVLADECRHLAKQIESFLRAYGQEEKE